MWIYENFYISFIYLPFYYRLVAKECEMANHLAKRIIPCLDIKDGQVVKGVNFIGLQNIGDPVSLARFYNDSLADELVILDITASFEHRQIIVELIREIAKEVYIPLTIGGGVKTLNDMYMLLDSGADKISINSAAIADPSLIEQAAKRFGSQCVVVAIDVRLSDLGYEVYVKGGRERTGILLDEWVKVCEEKGAGEFLLTSMDTDGTKNGYDIGALQMMRRSTSLPIIASGGAGKVEHLEEIFSLDVADAALAASIFHNNEISIIDVKHYLDDRGISVRL